MNPMYIYMIKYLMFPKVTLTCFILNIALWKYSMSLTLIDGFKIKRTKAVKHLGWWLMMHLPGLIILTKIACGVEILKRIRSFIPKQSLLILISATATLCGGSAMKLFLIGCYPCKTRQQDQ